jgi:hypothetical protein
MQSFSFRRASIVALGGLVFSTSLLAQVHGRKYKPPPDTTKITVTVLKGFNGKALPNAAVVLHSTKDGKDNGNLELKTDPDGQAALDLIETGSHVVVQVFATGFATHSEEFDLTAEPKTILVKLQRPKAQISSYSDDEGKPAETKPGVQERQKPATTPNGTGHPQ